MTTEGQESNRAAAIEERVMAFVRDELIGSGAAVTREDDLLSGGLLDSIGVLRLAAFVEQEFGHPVPPADFVIEHFQSVAALAAYVARATADRVPGGAGR
jgi:acyl carrier protein